MKKILTIIALALVSSVTFAAGHFGADAVSGTFAASGAVAGAVSVGNGSGQATQTTAAGGANATFIQAFSDNTNGVHTVDMGATFASGGNTYSASTGIATFTGAGFATGATAGLAVQGSTGSGYALGGAADAAADADSFGFGVGAGVVVVDGTQGSLSGSAVTDKGTATDDAFGFSIAAGVASIDVDAQPHDVTIVESSDVFTSAGGGSVSTVTGLGIAGGLGGGIADANAFTISGQTVIAIP